MTVTRSEKNPLIKPADVKPSRPDFGVIGVFNAGVTHFNHEIVLLVRVAERPINQNKFVCLAPRLEMDTNRVVSLAFETERTGYDFSDPREIVTPGARYLTSISHLRVARSSDGINFKIDEIPALFPANAYETFGIEDARITMLNDIFYINYSAVSELGIVTQLASTQDFLAFEGMV